MTSSPRGHDAVWLGAIQTLGGLFVPDGISHLSPANGSSWRGAGVHVLDGEAVPPRLTVKTRHPDPPNVVTGEAAMLSDLITQATWPWPDREPAFPFELRVDRWPAEVHVDGTPTAFVVVGGADRWVAEAPWKDGVVRVEGRGFALADLALRWVPAAEVAGVVQP